MTITKSSNTLYLEELIYSSAEEHLAEAKLNGKDEYNKRVGMLCAYAIYEFNFNLNESGFKYYDYSEERDDDNPEFDWNRVNSYFYEKYNHTISSDDGWDGYYTIRSTNDPVVFERFTEELYNKYKCTAIYFGCDYEKSNHYHDLDVKKNGVNDDAGFTDGTVSKLFDDENDKKKRWFTIDFLRNSKRGEYEANKNNFDRIVDGKYYIRVDNGMIVMEFDDEAEVGTDISPLLWDAVLKEGGVAKISGEVEELLSMIRKAV